MDGMDGSPHAGDTELHYAISLVLEVCREKSDYSQE